jgi:iron complex outermembrane recepter protein
MNVKPILLTATALGMIMPVTSAFAQSAPAARVDESEIIVTARKRQESILKVPVTVTALSEVQLERRQIKNIVDVSKYAVGLKLGLGAVETGALVSIRGFGTNATDPGVDQSVSLNLDGLQLTQGMSYAVGTFDMQQVEVLKGPQALFFGKASPAGVVAIRTNDPGDRFEFIGRTGYEFVANEWRSELILSGPVTDTFGLRLATSYDDFGGYFRNREAAILSSGALPAPSKHGETKSIIVRGTAVWKPSAEFSARLKLNYTRDRQKGANANQLTFCPEGTTTLPAFVGAQFAPGEQCKLDRNLAIVGNDPAAFTGAVTNNQGLRLLDGGQNASRIKQKFGSLELNYDVTPEIGLTSVTGYYKLNVAVDYNCQSTGAGASACMTLKRFSRKDFTEEVRATSDFSGPFNFTAGGFYQKGTVFDKEILPGNTRYFLPPLVFEGNMKIHIEALSAFAQARYKIVPQLELSAGARFTHEKRSLDSVTYSLPFTPFNGGPATFGMPIDLTNPKLNSKNWAPEATITYTPTDDFTLFGSWKRAYKSGSYNIITPTNPGPCPAGSPPTCVPVVFANGRGSGTGLDRSFGDEKIQGFELGLKTRLLDRQLDFNVTGYHYKASDLQVGTIPPSSGGLPVLITLNAASAKIKGIEADFRYRPASIEGLELFGAVNYNRARFTSFPDFPCNGGDTFADGCNRNPGIVTSQTDVAFTTGRAAVPATATTPAVPARPANLPPGVTAESLPMALRNGDFFRYNAEDIGGTPLVRAPDWSATAGFYYTMPMGEMKLGLGGDVQYSSKYLTLLGLSGRPEYYQKGFWKFNASVSLAGADDLWELAFVGNNLTDKLVAHTRSGTALQGALFFVPAITGGPGRGAAGRDELSSQAERGRELWIRLTVKFGS